MKRAVIGILAHVDSGKTTLSEAILYKCGVIRKTGRVDHGDAFMDSHDIEKERGITIFSSQAVFEYEGSEFTLVDTPGHVDFSSEAERSLKILDAAVLVVSATDGVQSHTETLWRLLSIYNIPTFVYVNKTDIARKNAREIIDELKHRLGVGFVDFSHEFDEETKEDIATGSEALMECFLDGGEFSQEDIADAVKARSIFPCHFGSALAQSGIDSLLSSLSKYTVTPDYSDKFGALVFKIGKDERGERLTHIKVTGGTLAVRDTLVYKDSSGEERLQKINAIRIYSGTKFKTVQEVSAGQVCALTGLDETYCGLGLGFENDYMPPVLEPVLSYVVKLHSDIDPYTALAKFKMLEQEDPLLHIKWNERLREIHFDIMGEVQLEVLRRVIADRFQIDADFDYAGINYKETVLDPTLGVGHYEPLRHYAEVQLLIEPLPLGSGCEYYTDDEQCGLDKNFRRLVHTHLREKTHVGTLTGSPLTDVKITLVAGRSHDKHTEGGDFRQATYRALRNALRRGKCVLLEPWYDFVIELPGECTGRAMNDISQMGGEYGGTVSDGENTVLHASAPVSELRSYHTELLSYTKGRGRINFKDITYKPCHNTEEVTERIAYDVDADIYNTADSVFCANGAGFVVKWDEVDAYKHTQTEFEKKREEERVLEEVKRTSAAKEGGYEKRIADEAEIMRMFEMTYGPVKRYKQSDFEKVRREASKSNKNPKAPRPFTGKYYLLIDGYNIIFAWNDLKKLSESSLDLARETLISRVANYSGVRGLEVILVFDAYKVKHNGEVERRDGITVVYTKEAETADMYIEKATHELARDNRVTVATSDGLEQLIILGAGAVRMTADELKHEVDSAEREIRDYLGRQQK